MHIHINTYVQEQQQQAQYEQQLQLQQRQQVCVFMSVWAASVTVDPCIFMCVSANSCVLVHIHVYWCIFMCISACSCVLVYRQQVLVIHVD